MPESSRCPSRDVLEQFVLGQVPEPELEKLEQHLDQCPPCGETVQGLRLSDTWLDAVRLAKSGLDRSVEPELDILKVRLRDLQPQRAAVESASAELAASGGSPPGAATLPLSTEADAEPAAINREYVDSLLPPEKPDEIGRLGPYRVLTVLGAGGMGVVYLAEDPQLHRRVALKVMKPALAVSESAKKRFLREARAAAALQNDHIVTIFQVGEDRGVPFLAMQLLEGESLEDRLRRIEDQRRTSRDRRTSGASPSAVSRAIRSTSPKGIRVSPPLTNAASCIATSSRLTSGSNRNDRPLRRHASPRAPQAGRSELKLALSLLSGRTNRGLTLSQLVGKWAAASSCSTSDWPAAWTIRRP